IEWRRALSLEDERSAFVICFVRKKKSLSMHHRMSCKDIVHIKQVNSQSSHFYLQLFRSELMRIFFIIAVISSILCAYVNADFFCPRMYGATEIGQHHFCLSYDLSAIRKRPYRLKSFFLPNISSEAADRFCSILLNENMTKAELRDEITKWAMGQGITVARVYARWLRKHEQAQQAIALKRRTLATSLSDEAKAVHENIEAILRDQNITPEEEALMVADVFNNASSEVRAELHALNDAVTSRSDAQHRLRERLLEHIQRFRLGIAEHFQRMNHLIGSFFGKNCERCYHHMHGCHHCFNDTPPAPIQYFIDARRVHYWP
uniref:SXP/RAL-2 family protein Ani s 5-like cation-binding domain-containing protein n=2 Tax=Parascaris TaxID=6254 RepID=A0A915BYH7_PARUN